MGQGKDANRNEPDRKAGSADERRLRQAEALRQNLRRRKAQARALAEEQAAPPGADLPPQRKD